MIIAKVFVPKSFGEYSFMMAQSLLFSIISDLGIRNILNRTAAIDEIEVVNKYFSLTIVSGFMVNMFLVIIYILYSVIVGGLDMIPILSIGFYSYALFLSNSLESIYLGKQIVLPTIFSNITTSVLWLLFVIIFIDNQMNIDLFFFIFSLIFYLKPIYLIFILYKKHDFRFCTTRFHLEFKSLFVKALPFFGLTLVALPANNLALMFLASNSTLDQVGFFTLAQKFTIPVSMVLTILYTSISPNLNRMWVTDKIRFKRMIIRIVVNFVIIGSICVSVAILFVSPIFKLFFSTQYDGVLIIIEFQIWYVFLFGIVSLLGTIFTAMHEDSLLFRLSLANCLIITPILWIGSMYNGIGLSYAYLFGLLVFLVLEWLIFVKKTDIPLKVNLIWLLPLSFILFELYFRSN